MFTHLHVHTTHSLLDGFGKIDEYIERCKELDFNALAITDHGNIDGTLKFYKKCTEKGIKPIIGAELYIVKDIDIRDRKEERGHITLLCKNDIGWINLKKLVTFSNLKGFYYKPRIDIETLLAHSKGLIIMSACIGSFIRFDWGVNLLHQLNKKDLYIEIMPHNFEGQREFNNKCLEINKEFGYKLVATNDLHYVDKDDAQSQEVLLAIQTQKKWNDPNRWKFDGEFWVKTRKEMIDSFAEQGVVPRITVFDAIENAGEVADKCNLVLEKKEVSLPEVIKGEDEEKFLENLIYDNYDNKIIEMGIRGTEQAKKYTDRFESEFRLIKEKGFIRYFLMVWELINWCKENDIMVGPGRGSSSGSLVCYLLGITQVDPIKYDLVFSRFISDDRQDLPDIDIDFEDTKRHLIRKHLEELYGELHVAGISTFSIMRGRSALKDVSRVFDVPLTDVGKICAVIEQKIEGEEGNGETIKDAIENFEEGKEFYKKYKRVVDIAIKMEGVQRQRGVHAAALVVSNKDLTDGERCSLVLNKEKEQTINWDKDDIEFVGLMKLDVLGLKMLSVLNHCRKLVDKKECVFDDTTPVDFNPLVFVDIPLDDEKCYKEFNSGKTIGCFQVESPGLRKFCQQLGVNSFDMIMSATSLYRPGPLRSKMAEIFVKRKHGEEELKSISPIIDSITKDTLGIIVYQEQMMRLVRELAGFDWIEVNKIRKLIAKSKGKGALQEYEGRFVEGCIQEDTLTEIQARDLWGDLISFGAYSFSKAHACAYSIITYWGMWLKVHYPLEYICSLLTYGSGGKDKKNEYIMEAFRLGVEIRPPKIGISNANTWVILDGILYAPFMEIFGIGEKTAEKYTKLGKDGFYNKDGSPKKLLELLDKIDAKENKPVTDDDADRISPFLAFSLVKNKLRKYKNLKSLLDRSVGLSKLSDLDLLKVDAEPKFYFGEITEVNLTVRRGRTGSYTSASASFRDETGDCKFQFENKFYTNYKDQVEKCEDEVVLMFASSPKSAGSLIVEEMWFYDDLMNCNLQGLFPEIIEERRFRNKELLNCNSCKLVEECKSPILPTTGHANVMIISDTPNIVDEKNKELLTGDGGEILWKQLRENGHDKNGFQVSSVVKCFPSISKKVTKLQINTCSKWIKEEFKILRPPIVLALGSTNLKFFKDEDSGIIAKCGTTEWNEEYGFWICWCINPNSVLYTDGNKELFKQGIDNFCNKLNILLTPF